jgi:hypothetical protein
VVIIVKSTHALHHVIRILTAPLVLRTAQSQQAVAFVN